jgi:NAD(P)-dependent dehydrogenase (short-subunit alcohol dehydrogenase family)
MTDVGAGDLEGRRAVVVGGGSGIGEAVVRELERRGAEVTVGDVAGVGSLPCDVTDEASVAAFFAPFDGLDIAVNCAGVSGTYGALADLSLDSWERTIAVNLTGTFLCLREEIALMGAGGSIVNISSGAGLRGFANLPDYVASKHGVIGLTRAAALEHARSGPRINVVAPGSIRTPMLEAFCGGDEGALDRMGRMSPIGRLGTPEEVAAAVGWLSSDAASFITGVVLSADGGVSAA